MGKQFFQTSGINLGDVIHHLAGTGAAGGTTDTDNAPVGSFYHDGSTGGVYRKISAGAGTIHWEEMAGKTYVDAISGGASWREPARLLDNTAYADIAAAQTAMNTGTLNGVAIAAGDRILLTGIANPASQNVHTITGTVGSGATLVEDSNAESTGDALFIQEGTEAGKSFSYNGTSWAQMGGQASTELGFLQAFMGKGSAGNELPAYASNTYIADGEALTVAISGLDAALTLTDVAVLALQNADTGIIAEIDAIEASLGAMVDTAGAFVAPSGSTYLDATGDISAALLALDTAVASAAGNTTEVDNLEASLGTQVDANGAWVGFTGTNYLDGDLTNTSALTTLDNMIFGIAGAAINLIAGTGLQGDGTYLAEGDANYIGSATSLMDADLILDTAIKTLSDELDVTQAGAGLDVDGNYVPESGSVYLDAATSLHNATVLLDTAIDDVAGTLTDALTGAGLNGDGTYTANGTADYIAKATSLADADNLLDAAVKGNADAIVALQNALGSSVTAVSVTGITTATAVDSVLVDEADAAKWLVTVIDEATPSKKVTTEVFATHDGTPIADATAADFTEYGRLKTSGNIAGLDLYVDVSGVGAAQELRLVANATGTISVKATRLKVV